MHTLKLVPVVCSALPALEQVWSPECLEQLKAFEASACQIATATGYGCEVLRMHCMTYVCYVVSHHSKKCVQLAGLVAHHLKWSTKRVA